MVVPVWWSQCPPCRAERPELNDVAAEGGPGLSVLGKIASQQTLVSAVERVLDE